ncbi:outer membrane lipoprotein-sorting protein [bacterium]|nr:outer membrane lipoprotein-sorting protein [bacterium]
MGRAALAATIAGALWSGAVRADDAARDLVRRVLDALPKQTSQATVDLTVKGQPTRTLAISNKIVNGARGSYIEVTAPSELAGMRFLFLQPVDGPAQQYLKVTASRKVILVAEEIRKQPFLGSTFYVSDLVEPKLDDFDYAVVGEETLLGRPCTLVEARPKNPDGIYSRTVLSLDPKDLLILRRQFFAPDGTLSKVWTIDQVDQVDGVWTLMRQTMEDVRERASSRLDVKTVQYGIDLPDEMFTPKYLAR